MAGAQMPVLQVAPLPATLPGTVVPPPVPPSNIWWSVAIPAAPSAVPVVTADHVYVARLPGTIAAYSLNDGREAWSIELNPEQPMVVDGGMLFAASGEAIHAVRISDGTVAWRRPVGALTAPLLAKDGWVLASASSRLMALRAQDGTPVWTHDATLQRERAAISGDTLFIPRTSGHMEARDLATGNLKWQMRVGGAPSEPLVLGDQLYFGATDKYFYCVDADGGEIEWSMRIGATLRGRASSDGTRVYFTALDNLVRAVDLGHGALRWHTGVPFRPLTGPLTFGDKVIVAGPVGIRVLNAFDGKPAGALEFPQKLATAPAAFAEDRRILVAAVTGSLNESWQLSLAALPLTATVPLSASPPR